jgi:hypothetical protein
MALIGPGYLSQKSLPYASDVFYHQKLTYFSPTGFHPTETNSVIEFPGYCHQHSIALPEIIWEMPQHYFNSAKALIENSEILEPLRDKVIKLVQPVYARDRSAIDRAKATIIENPILLEKFKLVDLDLQLVSRELLSHVLYGLFLEEGFSGAIQYIHDNSKTSDDFLLLIASVLVNRLRALFIYPSSELLLYEHSWSPIIHELARMVDVEKSDESSDSTVSSDRVEIENFKFKLFEVVLSPLFGRCDSYSKSMFVAQTLQDRQEEINVLKQECGYIGREVILLPTSDPNIKQEVLQEQIKKRILEPLSDISRKPKQDILKLLTEFTLDGSVMGGILTIFQGFNPVVLGTGAATAALSVGLRYLLSERSQKSVNPSNLLVKGMNTSRIKYEEIQTHLNAISMSEITVPDKLT